VPTIQEYLDLAIDGYNNATVQNKTDGWTEVKLRNSSLTENKINGYFARVYEKESSIPGQKDVTIVYRGSDDLADALTQDIPLGVNHTSPSQFDNAQALYNAVKDLYPDSKIVPVGHSLGGNLAELVAAVNKTGAVTFNGAGTKQELQSFNARYGNKYYTEN
jgi:predicted alpha/beta hydrolase